MMMSFGKAAEIYKDITKDLNLSVKDVKEDLKKLLENVYVDDGTIGGSKREVDRMKGTKLQDGSFSGTIPNMMKKVGLHLKTIVTFIGKIRKYSQNSQI